MSKRDEYVAKMKQQLDELNARIAKLDARADEAKGELREEYKEQIATLRQRSQKFQNKLDKLKDAGEDQWKDLVKETEKVRDALVHSFNYFKSQL